MMKTMLIAALLAPTLGTLIWYLIFLPGRKFSDYLWKKMPEGKLRTFLTKERQGKWITINPPKKPFDL